jgi:mono/diheme cytochrome c family protein
MNYPIWDLPASGLLIALVAILHVFVSHFAVGGGLFLVVTEWKARRENDASLLDYLKRHTRFFVLLTLVFGAVTGVGIWFTIGLVHPAATSSLINAFVWAWAIEWVFFLTEIAAAIVYFYGWDRLTPRQHMAVGWVYFVSAWMSLVVISGILTFMLTPGAWIESRDIWSAFFNPTYWPSVVIRTLGAMGLAGVYALFTASWLTAADMRPKGDAPELVAARVSNALALKRKLSAYAAAWWVLPMAIGLPLSLLWYFAAADAAGAGVAEIFGSASSSVRDLVGSMFTTSSTGHPVAQRALRTAFGSITVTILLVFALFLFRREKFGRVGTAAVMLAALASIGGSEWVREGLRKPYVIGSYMFVNGLRVPLPAGSLAEQRQMSADPLRIDQLSERGVLAAAHFVRLPESPASGWSPDQQQEAGGEVFRLLCSQCHTLDGYLAMRPLVKGSSAPAIETMLGRLAIPIDGEGHDAAWSSRGFRLASWRNRRMPPFVGTPEEKRALAVYLAGVGGGSVDFAPATDGAAIFESNCGICHGSDGDMALDSRLAGRTENEMYDVVGRLPEINDAMPPFEGTEEERRALAGYLAALAEGRR